jgi:hypothetical protein
MSELTEAFRRGISPLLGLKLSAANYAGNVRLFQFGDLTFGPGHRVAGLYALHLQCPWRLERHDAILTGLQDWYTPIAEADSADPDWDPAKGGSLQESELRKLMDDTASTSRSVVNRTDKLLVTNFGVDGFGGFTLDVSGDIRLSVFPAGSRNEQWRLLQPGSEARHLVIEAGKALSE